MFRYSLICLLLFGSTSPAWASWADGMFDELSRDFGPVPHGHMATHPFRLVNRTGNTVHISSVRVSCGCTSAQALQNTLAPGQDTAILVQMDTRRFYGFRAVTIYVQFDQPSFDEARLVIQANSRDDLTMAPDSFQFGQIEPGKDSTGNVTVSFLGDDSFRITGARCDSNYIQVDYEETRRQDGEVAYRVSARLRPEVPPGTWYTDVWLSTNNANVPRLRVPLNVEIAAPPKTIVREVAIGTVKAGSETARQVIVHGTKPFRVTAITGGDDEVRVHDASDASRPTHVLTIKVRPANPGQLNRIIRVRTDLPNSGEIELKTAAQVVP
jgi:hypothetical protein